MKYADKITFDLISKIDEAGKKDFGTLWSFYFKAEPNGGGFYSAPRIRYSIMKQCIRKSSLLFQPDAYEAGTLILNENGKNYLSWIKYLTAAKEKSSDKTDLQLLKELFGETVDIPSVPENAKALLFLAEYINAHGEINTEYVDFTKLLTENGFAKNASTYELEKMGIVCRTIRLEQNKNKHFLSVSDEKLSELRSRFTLRGHYGELRAEHPDKTPLELSYYSWCTEKKRNPFEWYFQMYYLGICDMQNKFA